MILSVYITLKINNSAVYYAVCLLFLCAWIPAGGYMQIHHSAWHCRRHMENINIINADTHRFSDVNILISCAGNVVYCLLCSMYCLLSTQMILKWNENWQNWWLINTITSLEWNPVCWQPWKKTSTLQTLLKMHHTEAGSAIWTGVSPLGAVEEQTLTEWFTGPPALRHNQHLPAHFSRTSLEINTLLSAWPHLQTTI